MLGNQSRSELSNETLQPWDYLSSLSPRETFISQMSMRSAIVWVRSDLRLEDNQALAQAIAAGHRIVPLFIWAPNEQAPWQPGAASCWWLHGALADLDTQLRSIGSRLVFRRVRDGESSEMILRGVAKQAKATAIYWNRRYEPAITARDTHIKKALQEDGFDVKSTNSGMLYEPHEIANKSGKPFRVFTPMWRHYRTLEMPKPVDVDLAHLKSSQRLPKGDALRSLDLLPKMGRRACLHTCTLARSVRVKCGRAWRLPRTTRRPSTRESCGN